MQTALDTIQIHRGYRSITEYEVERALRDARGSDVFLHVGDATKHHRTLAGLLAAPARHTQP